MMGERQVAQEALLRLLQGPLELCGFFALSRLQLRRLPCLPLLLRLSRQPGGTRARAHGEPLAREPCLEDAADDIERASLDHATADVFTPPNTNIYYTLEGEGEAVGGMLIERCWV